jgi:hypothetical protein
MFATPGDSSSGDSLKRTNWRLIMAKHINKTAVLAALVFAAGVSGAPAFAEDIGTGFVGTSGQEDIGTGFQSPTGQEDIGTGFQSPTGQEDIGTGFQSPTGQEDIGTGLRGPASQEDIGTGRLSPTGQSLRMRLRAMYSFLASFGGVWL